MRTVEEIKADMQKPCDYTDKCELTAELVLALTAGLHNNLDRLEEICEAEREGRCVVLPCKVGDTVYIISACENVRVLRDDDYLTGTGATSCPFESDCEFEDCDDANVRIFETTATDFWYGENNAQHPEVFFANISADGYCCNFGKTVFLTRAEAVAALKGESHDR